MPFLPGMSTIQHRSLHFKLPDIRRRQMAMDKSPLYGCKSTISTMSWAVTTPLSRSLIIFSEHSTPRCAARVAATTLNRSLYSLASEPGICTRNRETHSVEGPFTCSRKKKVTKQKQETGLYIVQLRCRWRCGS